MKPDTVSYKLYTVNQIKTFQTMEALSELKRIATTVRHSLPPPRKTPRRERRARERSSATANKTNRRRFRYPK